MDLTVFLQVISTVRSTLLDLKLAIDGTIIMSENLRDALDSMYDAKIPAAWQKVCELTVQEHHIWDPSYT